MTTADALPLSVIALGAISGFRVGGSRSVIALVALTVGLALAGLAAPALGGGSWLPWATAAVALACLFAGLLVGVRVTGASGSPTAGGPLRPLDKLVGTSVGAPTGASAVWIVAVALTQDDAATRDTVRRSATAAYLLDALPRPPGLARPGGARSLPVITDATRATAMPVPDPTAIAAPILGAASRSVVKVRGSACSWEIEGSGWVVDAGRVVTNLHVVTGQLHPTVITPNGDRLRATISAIDPANDLALLSVPRLHAPTIALAAGSAAGAQVAVLGYPNDGPLAIEHATTGTETTPITANAYGRPVTRTILPLRTRVLHGASGGPVIDIEGRVVAVLFASNADTTIGYAVPLDPVRHLLAEPTTAHAAGPCPRS